MLFKIRRCQNCHHIITIDLGHFVNVLGPAVILCNHCHQPNYTDLKEWDALSPGEQTKFVLALIYNALFGGLLIALLVFIVWARPSVYADWQDERFLYLLLGVVAVMALIRIGCVGASQQRSRANAAPKDTSLLTWYLNLSLYYFIVFLVLLFFSLMVIQRFGSAVALPVLEPSISNILKNAPIS